MIIGVPKEIKQDEYRVSAIPAGVADLVGAGHEVLVETEAGAGSGIADDEYSQAGAKIVKGAADVWNEADVIVKVKEPQAAECDLIRAGQVVFTYFHFAANRQLTERIISSGCVAIAYETVRDARGRLPLLTPMSEVAGRMSVHEGAKSLEKPFHGRGILLGGVPGVPPAEVVIIGGGVVGANAAKVAAGLGALVVILEIDLDRMRYLDDTMPSNVITVMSNAHNIIEYIRRADLLIGAILIEGAKAPKLIKREHLSLMKPGAVIVDVAIDQGVCTETSRPTTHSEPTYIVDNIVHYCVANIPGAVSRTSTYALTNATFPYLRRIAAQGWREAAAADEALARGLNIVEGKVVNRAVAETFGLPLAEHPL
ncbi:MAG: alanine dehydrogenase [Planctomycetes bacterium]|nr:alanine dehydrogenase [Planctomycetota bacterium]